MSPQLPPRSRYRPSGRVDGPRFAALGAAVLGAAGLIAWLLWLGFEARFYAPLVFALGGGMIVGGLALLAVRLGHCRSPALALILGLVGGLLLQPGHHLLAYAFEDGREVPADLAGFLPYLDQRLSSVAIDWRLPPRLDDDEAAQPTRAGTLYLWATVLFEILFLPILCALPPFLRVLRDPYCEACSRWTERTRLTFFPASEEVLVSALEEGRLAEIAAAALLEPHPNHPALIGLLDVCPGPAVGKPAGYLSLRPSTGDAASAMAMEPLLPYYTLTVRCAELRADEVAALERLSPDRATAAILPSWAIHEGDDAGSGWPKVPADARIETVDQSHPVPAADRRDRQIAEALNLAPILGSLFGGFGLLSLAAWLEDSNPSLAYPLGALSFAVMGAGLWLTLMDPTFGGDRYLLRRLEKRLAARPDRRIQPQDGDAIAVALVPRKVWATADGKKFIDHGWLAVRDTLIYEGDRHRMEIPAASIEGVALEPLTVDQYQTWQFVVLRVRAADGIHTLPLVRVAAPLFATLFRGKKRRAQTLLQPILDLVAPPVGSSSADP